MRVAVDYQGERLEFDVDDDRVVGVWRGPASVEEAEVEGLVLDALEHPCGFPALRLAVVPGDRVVIPLDPEIPGGRAVLEAVCAVLKGSGVESGSIRVVAAKPPARGWADALPAGVEAMVHDPADRAGLAYLASTEQGRRVYLNRHLTDADFVLPIGRLGYDPALGYRGPWSVIFPDLSDEPTQRAYRAQADHTPPDRARDRPALVESAGVSWLLGSQFQLGVVAGAAGVAGVIAGLEPEVRAAGARAVDAAWSFRADHRADLVVVGIGAPGQATGIEGLAEGLATAARLVRRGGKIVALSRAEGPFGQSVLRLAGADDPRAGPAALRGAEGEPDYPAALQLARALAWADVYLWSGLDADQVDDLSIIPLGHPGEARRLASASPSCLFLSRAEATRGVVAGDE